MYLLDTDHCVFLKRRHVLVCGRFSQLANELAHISIITAGELLFGAYWSPRVEHNLMETNRFLDLVPILPLTRSIVDRFARIKADLYRAGHKLEDPDIMIAASALANGLTLVTHNTAHYERIDGLEIEDWSNPQP
jgi:predicted nucleic acid-binding protein